MPTGTGQSEPDVTRIRELEDRLDNLRIEVSDDLTIRGSAWQGYALNVPDCPQEVSGTGGNPCDNCDATSINLHVEGVTSCPGDFECVDVNGDWVLPFFDSCTWELDQEFDCGPFPITISFIVDCTVGLGFAVNITVGGTNFWFSGAGATWPASESNLRTCADGDSGEGGTASISL